MTKAVVIGLGMGQQYASWFRALGYDVVTVDPDESKSADYTDLAKAIKKEKTFDIAYIGTPNWTHEDIAYQIVEYARILLIEKPGFVNGEAWKKLNDRYSNRIVMVKNNQYRAEMSGYKKLVPLADSIHVVWSRKSGVPQSSWFVDKTKAFGGVSRDLMPHLLSYYTALTDYGTGTQTYAISEDKNGTGIDDYCELCYNNQGTNWRLTASWQNNTKDEHYIEFAINGELVRFELGDYMTAFGGCPAGPYMTMIDTVVKSDTITSYEYWYKQSLEDIWIHNQVEDL